MSAATSSARGYRLLGGAGPVLQQREFILDAGTRRKRVEIHEVDSVYHPNADPRTRFAVAALDRAWQIWIGYIDLHVRGIGDLPRSGCTSDLKTFEPRVHRDRVLHVETSWLDARYRGRGIGVGLYVAAAAAGRKRNLALVSDSCFGSAVSDEARRVWNSRAFSRAVQVGPSGETAAYRAPQRA